MSEPEIIKKILSGDSNSYRILVDKYQQGIFRICMGYVHNEDDANDLTQETFLNAYQNLKNFKFDANLSTWLYRIAINLSLNFIRSKKRNLLQRFEEAFESKKYNNSLADINNSDPEQLLIGKEHQKIIQKEIDKLSDKQKTAFVLSKYDNLPQKEIALIMKISEGAVESLLQRSKVNLQKNLSKYFKKK